MLKVTLNLTQTIVDVVDDAIIQGNGTDDSTLSSFITNAFTNLVSREQFISTEAKVNDHYFVYKIQEYVFYSTGNLKALFDIFF